jgi:class 3 adenylate cyclase
MAKSLVVHDAVVRAAIESAGGYVFSTRGDGFAGPFARASDAITATQRAQTELRYAEWPGPGVFVEAPAGAACQASWRVGKRRG